MTRASLYIYAGLAAAALFILANTLFVVNQREQALVLRFGEPAIEWRPAPGGVGRIRHSSWTRLRLKNRGVGPRSLAEGAALVDRDGRECRTSAC